MRFEIRLSSCGNNVMYPVDGSTWEGEIIMNLKITLGREE
jgi:hypothetical protein